MMHIVGRLAMMDDQMIFLGRVIVRTESVTLSYADPELYAPTTGTAERMVTKHVLKELGHGVALVSHVDSQSGTALASKRGSTVEVQFRSRCRGEEVNDSCLCQHEVEQIRRDEKVPYLRSTHETLRTAGSETQQRRWKTCSKPFDVM